MADKAGEWLTREGLALLAGWRRSGECLERIAQRVGVKAAVLDSWCAAHEEIALALQIDAETANFLVEDVLFHKSLSGDAKAYEFWLKHRMPEKWGKLAAGEEREREAAGMADLADLATLINNPAERRDFG